MKKVFLCVVVLSAIFFQNCQNNANSKLKTDNSQLTFHQAAEFEPTEAVWLLWSNYDHREGMSNSHVTLDIIAALVPHVNVRLVVKDSLTLQKVKTLVPKAILDGGKLTFLTLPYREFWARDMGPAFVVGTDGKLGMADFQFNGWGYSDTLDATTRLDEKLDERIAAVLGLKTISTDLITEGGDHEVNGRGTMLACEAVERTRNPDWSLAEIEAEFRRVLGVKKIIWLKKGLNEDDHTSDGALTDEKNERVYTVLTTNGHVDEFARFVNPTTVLLAEADSSDLKDPINRENLKRLSENYAILKTSTDQDGKPLTILRLPLPLPMVATMKPNDGVYDIIKTFKYSDGSTFPTGKPVKVIAAASYNNFLIANDVVLMPKYWRKGLDLRIKTRDEAAQAVLKSVFPDKKIVAIDALAVNFGGGGMHCITRNQPKEIRN